MKKRTHLLLIFISLTISPLFYAQVDQGGTGNYYDDIDNWEAYFDSVRAVNYSVGDSTMKGTGYTKYLRWKNYWDVYMTSSGSYTEALEVFKENSDYQKQIHLNKLENDTSSSSLSVSPVDWDELGPKNLSQILTKTGVGWSNPHINNAGNIRTAAHVGKVRKLYQHPTNNDVIYALGGDVEQCGGGVFVSKDKGNTWKVLGTDQIHQPKVTSLAVKPFGEQPDANNEYIFITLATGAVYRTSDDGETWLECGYNGVHSFPYDGGTINNDPLSLPYDGTIFNFSWTKRNHANEIVMTKKNGSAGAFSRLVVAREGGLYYSDNHSASLTATSSSIDNNIEWISFNDNSNLDILIASIPDDNTPFVDDRVIQYSDFEWYEKNGSIVYLTLIHIMEVNAGGTPLGRIRQYLLSSSDFGTTWSFMGENDSNSPHGKDILKANLGYQFRQSNIEVKNNDPNVIYIASTEHNAISNSYSLQKYNISMQTWEDHSRTGFTTFIGAQPHAFILDPSNEDDWWFFTNEVDKFQNGILSSFLGNYSAFFHADVRDVLVLDNELLAATDGGVYRSDIGTNDHIMNISSEGMNMSQSYSLGLAQSPPFYVASGFWHSGLQVYNPDQDIWHWTATSDGEYGEVFFLNNERFSFGTQYGYFRILKGFDDMTLANIPSVADANLNIFYGGRFYAGSENIPGRSYFTRYDNSLNYDQLGYNVDDFNTNNFVEFTNNNYQYQTSKPHIIPNEPDKVAVSFIDHNNKYRLHIYNGLNKVTPEQNLEKDFDIEQIYNDINGTTNLKARFMDCSFDHRRNGKFWMILKSTAEWLTQGKGRIVEYDPVTDDFIDISYPADDAPSSSSSFFPRWMNLSSIEMDRETGILYLGTAHGVYYLDRDNEIWKKYSDNVPMFNTNISIRHCTGEIYASTSYRGIWHTDLIRNENTPPIEWKITGNETWEDRMNLFCTLVIEPGAVLNVENDLIVYGNQKIIVKPGGRLYVNGGKITSECGSYWQGIEVWGNYQSAQSTANQGYLLITNNSTISYARTAVRLWELNNWASTGGIFQASNSVFKNNLRSVEYMPYHSISPTGNEIVNKGKITKCSFVWDDEYESVFGEAINPAITLCDVFGVRIVGSEFKDERNYVTDFTKRAIGIKSIDASYRVIGRRLSLGGINDPNQTHDYFDDTDFEPSVFENLFKGIEAMNANSQANILVDQSKFLNSRIGIDLSAVNNVMITRNYFDFNQSHFPEIFKMNHVYLRESSAFKIEGNIFENHVTSETIDGVVISNSGIEDNEVYRNKFENVYAANLAFGVNTNDADNAAIASGLQLLCNYYNNYRGDQMSIGGSTFGDFKGIRLKQGLPNAPAGNIFSTNLGTPLTEVHFSSTDADEITYYAYNNTPEIPTELIGNIEVSIVDFDESQCESTFGTPIIGVSGGRFLKETVKGDLDLELNSVNTTKMNRVDYLNSKYDLSNRPTLFEAVQNLDTTSWSSLKNDLEDASPFLSVELIKILGEQINPHYPHDWFTELILLNPEVAQSSEFMNYLEVKPVPLPESNYNEIDTQRYSLVSERGVLINEIISLEKRSTDIVDLLLKNELSDTNSVNWNAFHDYQLERNDEMMLQQITDQLFGNKALTEAFSALSSTSEYEGESHYEYINYNIKSYVNVKKYMLNFLMNDAGVIEELDSSEVAKLLFYRNQYKDYLGGVQASNLLCFHANICDDIPVYDNLSKQAEQSNTISKPINSTEWSGDLLLIPNPNKGTFVVKTADSENIKEVSVLSVEGRKVDFNVLIQKDQAQIQLNNVAKGVFYIQVLKTNNQRITKKFIVH